MRTIKLISIMLFIIGNSYAQTVIISKDYYKRTSDLLTARAESYPLGLNRFMQNLNINQYDDWTSPSSVVSLNNIPFRVFPLNYNTPDFLPADLLQLDSAEIYSGTVLQSYSSLPSGGVNLRTRSLADTSGMKLRLFTGSETGDPLIYHFTREAIPVVNKNKIVPSGVISLEGSGLFKYRITAGYFGYFAFNSSANSTILSGLSENLIKRQNRQMLGSAEGEYQFSGRKKLSVFSSVIHFYGWEIPPFITSFVHLRSLSFANRIKIENLADDLDAGIKYDANISTIKEMDLVPSAGFMLSDISGFFHWNLLKGIYGIGISGEVGRFSGGNLDPGVKNSQSVFDVTRSYFYYHFTPQLSFTPADNLMLDVNSRIEKNISTEHTYSGSLSLLFSPSAGHSFNVLMSSLSAFPSIFEKYGSFYTLRQTEPGRFPEKYYVTGQKQIIHERINSISFGYSYRESGFHFNLNPFYRNVVNGILLHDINVVQSIFPGDIIRKGFFINSQERTSGWGVNNSLEYDMRYIRLSLSHSGLYKSSAHSSNKLMFVSGIPIAEWGTVYLEIFHSSAYRFRHFETFNGQAAGMFPPEIPSISLFSIAYSHSISSLYALKDIKLSLRIDNAFNRRLKFHPMGNNIDRAIEFYLSFHI